MNRLTRFAAATAILAASLDAHAVVPQYLGDLGAAEAAKQANLGSAIAVSGDTMIVGAPHADAGAAYVYVRSGDHWTLQAKLLAPGLYSHCEFGYRVAISGDTAVVSATIGAYLNDGYDIHRGGAAYVFVRSGTTWTFQVRLNSTADGSPLAENPNAFGRGIAIDGDVIVASAPSVNGSGSLQGSAYVFRRSAGHWTFEQQLNRGDAHDDDFFGDGVAVHGDTIAIGTSPDELHGEPGHKSVQIYTRSNGAWSLQQQLPVDGAGTDTDDDPRMSLAFADDALVVGAPGSRVPGHEEPGAAYVFRRALFLPTWSLESRLVDPEGDHAHFGKSIAFNGNILLVASCGAVYSDPSCPVYTFLRSSDGLFGAGAWSAGALVAQPPAAAAAGRAGFGSALAVTPDDQVVVSAPWIDVKKLYAAGTVSVYRVPFDYGDAPAPYPSLRLEGGARHAIGGPLLGARVDAEADAKPDAASMGDDASGVNDDDGARFATDLVPGAGALLSVDVRNGPAKVDAWVDFDGNGNWSESGERIADHVAVSSGVHPIAFRVPATARLGKVQVRVRVSTVGSPLPTGTALDGEVEDFTAQVRTATLSIADLSQAEGSPGTRSGSASTPFVFLVTLGSVSANPVRVDYRAASAARGGASTDDFTPVHGTLTIPAGATSATITVPVVADRVAESDEHFMMMLSNPVGATLSRAQATGTIVNDD